MFFMNRTLRLLFPETPKESFPSLLILALRVAFGLLFLRHGIEKTAAFDELITSFPDPLGVGSTLSLSLVIFAELFCSIAFIIGALFRLCLIPMMFTMIMAVFVIHGNDAFAIKETALMYLMLFAVLFVSGPGKFSVDAMIRKAMV